MPLKITGAYPPDWEEIARRTKSAAGWRCVRCRHAHDPPSGHTLTVHHWDGFKGNCAWWNLLPLCQRCHLAIQAKVNPDQPWVFEHSAWFRPYVAGYYAAKYLGLHLTRDEVIGRLEKLLTLEANAIIGRDPLPVEVHAKGDHPDG